MMKDDSRIQMALNDLRAGRYREALAGFEDQTNRVKSDAGLIQAAFAAAKGAKEWVLAENYLDSLLVLLPNRFEVHSTAGTFFQDQRRYGLATESFKRAIELKPCEPGLYYNLALALFESEAFLQARTAITEAIRLKNDYYKAMVLLGRILNKLKLHDDSIELFLRAISIDPDSYIGYFRLAEVSAEHGDLDTAKNNYQKALVLEPSNPEINAAIAESYLSLGEIIRARDVIRQGLSIDPAHPKLNRYFADLKFELGDSKVFDQYHHSIKGDVSSELIGDYAKRLLVVDDLAGAEMQLDILKSRFGEIDVYRELQVCLLLKQGNHDQAWNRPSSMLINFDTDLN